jgi:hypothetical protein
MTFDEKLDHYVRDMEARGIPPRRALPGGIRLLHRLGWRVPPPPFLGLGAWTLLKGVPFGLGWGAVMWLTTWSKKAGTDVLPAVIIAALVSILAGAMFGFLTALTTRPLLRRLGLGRWEDYPAGAETIRPADDRS